MTTPQADQNSARQVPIRLSVTDETLHGLPPSLIVLTSPHDSPFSLSFTAASLRPDLVRVVAESFVATGDWNKAKARILTNNLLQARSPASGRRMERELRQRLMRLTSAQIQLAAHGMTDERTAIAWLAAVKGSAFIYSFASDLLRSKLALLDPVLRASDYEAFLLNQNAAHPELAALTPSSKAKIRAVLFSMIREAGIGTPTGREVRVQRPLIPPAVLSAIRSDSSQWLAGFLIPDGEIAAY